LSVLFTTDSEVEGAHVEQARAQFKDGVLEVTVPVPEAARKRREIPIEAAPMWGRPSACKGL
jgi:hypothetical protein